MIGIRNERHPRFEALSAYADRNDLEAAGTRVARHVAECAACRAVVAEVRSMGDAARAMSAPDAPSHLWSRIAAGAGQAAQPASIPASVPPLADVVPTPGARSAVARLAIGAGVVLSLALLALWPRTATLQAADPSRLTFSPARPKPGGTATIRYVPPPGTPVPSRFILVGRYARPAGWNPQGLMSWAVDQLADSLAELTPAGDGAFVATMRLPADFLAVSLAVHDPAGNRLDLDGAAPWMIVGGTPAGGASLTSLLAAQDTRAGIFNLAALNQPRQAVDFADSLKRYFPQHPAGWAFTHSYGMSRGQFDFLRFFRGAERKYASLFDALWPQPALDAERLHDMVVFARNIDEPGEARRWAGRLIEEHPEDPRALHDLAVALHEAELTGTPAAADTVRRWLPALDRTYRSAPVPNPGYDEARGLAERYGDSVTRATWIARGAEIGAGSNAWRSIFREGPRARNDALAEMRRGAGRACTLAPGVLPLAASVDDWRARCELYRGLSYGYLSSLTLQAGQPRQALGDADSAIVAMRRADNCAWPRGQMAHALAALALGDTATAESDFIIAAARYPAGGMQVFDTAQARLGARFDRDAVTVRLDSARQAVHACEAEARPRRQARMERRPGYR